MFERVSGKPLEWLFTQWLTRPGIPKLEGSWRYDAAAKQVEVTVSQSQAAEPFRLNVEIGIVTTPGAQPRVERLAVHGRQATLRFAADSPPASVVLDPDTWLLFEAGPFSQAR